MSIQKPGRDHGTRWVAHKLKALAKLDNYSEGKTNRNKAKGIRKQLLSYKLVLHLHFMQDVWLPSVLSSLDRGRASLHNIANNESVKLRQFYSQVEGTKYKGQTWLHPVAKESSDEKRATIQYLTILMPGFKT